MEKSLCRGSHKPNNMSQHFTSIFENLRFVAIKRTTNAQQQQQPQQQQQQQSPLPTPKATPAEPNKIKTKAPAALNGNGQLLSTNLGGVAATSHEVDHSKGASGTTAGASVGAAGGGTPLKHHKRTSISTSASPQPGRERRGTNTSIVVELDDGVGGQNAAGASGSGTASSKSSRELSPTPKNAQQPRKMSQDYRSRAGR